MNVPDDKLEELIASNRDLATASDDLAMATLKHQERERAARRRFRVTLLALAVVGLVLLGGIFRLLHEATGSRNQIRGCIVPDGKCYKDNQARLKGTIGQVEQIVIYAATCAPNYIHLPMAERNDAIQACIDRALHR